MRRFNAFALIAATSIGCTDDSKTTQAAADHMVDYMKDQRADSRLDATLDFQFDATADMIAAQDAQVDALVDAQTSTIDSELLELDSSVDGMLIEVMDFRTMDLTIED